MQNAQHKESSSENNLSCLEGKKNIIAIIIYEELINSFERFLYFPGYDCKAKNLLSDFFPPSPYLQILPNRDIPFHKKELSIKREFEKNFNCSN